LFHLIISTPPDVQGLSLPNLLAYLPLAKSSPTVGAAQGPTHVPQIGTPDHEPPALKIVRAILFPIATTAIFFGRRFSNSFNRSGVDFLEAFSNM
jgi:hypothetical protein